MKLAIALAVLACSSLVAADKFDLRTASRNLARHKEMLKNKGGMPGDFEQQCYDALDDAFGMCPETELLELFDLLDCSNPTQDPIAAAAFCSNECYDMLMNTFYMLRDIGCEFIVEDQYCGNDMDCDSQVCVHGRCRDSCDIDSDCFQGCENPEDEQDMCCSDMNNDGIEVHYCCEIDNEGPDDGLVSSNDYDGIERTRQIFDLVCHQDSFGTPCVVSFQAAMANNTCEAFEAIGCCLHSAAQCGDNFLYFGDLVHECGEEILQGEACQECVGAPPCREGDDQDEDPCQILAEAGFCFDNSEFQPYMRRFCPYSCNGCDSGDQCLFDDHDSIIALAAGIGISVDSCEEAVQVAAGFYGTPYCSGPYSSFLEGHCPCSCIRANNAFSPEKH